MTIAIYGSRRQEANATALKAFFHQMHDRGVDVVMHRHLYNSLVQLIPAALKCVKRVVDTPDFTADTVISFGGDGTFLRTAMWVGDKQIPILGVNTGHLGYLTTASVSDLPSVLDELAQGDYTVERRQVLQVVSPEIDTWPYALNEVVVSKYDTSSMITADACINRRPLASYRADGLIVATPTGSTAYNLSVGGPIIQPMTSVWVLSPISAHSLGMRPLVVSNDCDIEIRVSSRATGFRLTLDGRTGTLPVNTEVCLRRAPFDVCLICRHGYEFPSALRNKLFWGQEMV